MHPIGLQIAVGLAVLVLWDGAASAGDAAKGKQTYARVGCFACHGHQGQGGVAGLKLAPDPLPYELSLIHI